MMTLREIKSLRDRAPFQPFRVHLTNGETLLVPHPDYLSVQPEPGTELFIVWAGPRWNILDVNQVARVSQVGQPSGSAAAE